LMGPECWCRAGSEGGEESPSAAAVIGDASTVFGVSGECRLESAAGQQDLGFSPAISGNAPRISLGGVGFDWAIDALLPHVRGLEAYVIPTLVVVLMLSIAFQLSAVRRLRRAMREMGLILDIVEEIYADGMFAATVGSGAVAKSMPGDASAPLPEHPVIEFSPVERAVLQAMSAQREVQEKDLANILAEKGFTGVLVRAVIGEIIRKTSATGLPWVEVRYIRGLYRYQLRSEEVSSLSQEG
jgi:hypothetical protein